MRRQNLCNFPTAVTFLAAVSLNVVNTSLFLYFLDYLPRVNSRNNIWELIGFYIYSTLNGVHTMLEFGRVGDLDF